MPPNRVTLPNRFHMSTPAPGGVMSPRRLSTMSFGALLRAAVVTLRPAGAAEEQQHEAHERQFVVIAAGDRRVRSTGGVYVAFALPEDRN
jgi:hypothetical protein